MGEFVLDKVVDLFIFFYMKQVSSKANLNKMR